MVSSNENNKKKSPWDDAEPVNPKPMPNPEPNVEDLFRRSQSSFNDIYGKFKKKDTFSGKNIPENNGKFFGVIATLLFVAWLSTGFYIVDEGEQALVIRFGKYERTTSTGLNYHLPQPIEHVIKEKVDTLRKEEIGFRSSISKGTSYNNPNYSDSQSIPHESLILTGDQNIIEINFIIQWKISNLKDFVFNIHNSRDTVRSVAESAMREVIGNTDLDRAITDGRSTIEHETKTLLQNILNSYGSGVEITTLKLLKSDPPAEVIDAFRDVQTAKTDKEREINRAYSFHNEIIPRARGEAAGIILEGEAYRKEVVEMALGEAERFDLILNQYITAKDITKKRIYLESMDSVLQGMDKIILDNQKNASVVPYLPLTQLDKGK